VSTNNVGPVHLLATLGSRRNAETAQDVTHGLIGNVVTQMRECTSDTIVSPVAILTSHADDEFGDLTSEGRSAR
jgi:hypothetical protein